jgi:hypothetical protein
MLGAFTLSCIISVVENITLEPVLNCKLYNLCAGKHQPGDFTLCCILHHPGACTLSCMISVLENITLEHES